MKGKLDEESRNVCIALKLGILSKGLRQSAFYCVS